MARSQELARLFQQPDSPAQRHYEVCRAYFHDSISADEIAKRFHLYGDTVRAIVRDFARDPDVNSFFTAVGPGRKTSPKRDAINERACDLRRQGATLADIHAALQREGGDVSESYLFRLLNRASTPTTVPPCPTSRMSGRCPSRMDGNSPPRWPGSSCSSPSCWISICPMLLPTRPCPARSRFPHCRRFWRS